MEYTFTDRQRTALEQFDKLAAELSSANKAGQRCGVSSSVISLIKSGTYKGNVANQLDKLIAYFDTKSEAQELYTEVDYAPTSISTKVYETIRACQIKGGFATVTGDAGIGKTKAVRKFVEDYPENSIFITINPCCKSTKSVLKLIAQQLGVPMSQSVDDLWMAVANRMHDSMVLIVDEAQLLTYHSIETLRSFSDYFDSLGQTLGVALVGNDGIREKIEGKTREAYRQINNRTWQRPQLRTANVKYSDIELLFPLLNGKETELRFLHKVAQTAEGVRGAVRLFSNAYDNERYDLAGLVAMAKAMRIDLKGLEKVVA